jgi:hypothetical protein
VKTILVGVLIVVCLAVILIPTFIVPSQPIPALPLASGRGEFRGLPFEGTPWLMQGTPFGMHARGWQGILSAVASWVYLYLTSALLLALFPRRMWLVTRALRSDGWRTGLRLFAIGLLAILASVLLVLLARFASVWVLLVIALIGALFLVSYLGIVGVSLALGGTVRRWANFSPSPWVELALGSLILFALGRIPIIGWIGVGIVAALGLGAVLATRLGSGEAWSLRGWETTELESQG